MHRRSISSDYQLTSVNQRNTFSSNPPTSQQAFYATSTASSSSSLPPPPPNTTQKPAHTNTFVHKLYNMVVDSHYQHLISWAYTGSSFIVCNIMEFSQDVLPKHFKHNNFSSFVRQLNMYGFHKVNKSPRGHRTLAENQIWEFSHPKFLRNRPDLLDDIKRKSMEVDNNARRETSDLQNHIAMLQASQSEMIQQIRHLYENFTEVLKELEVTKQKQDNQIQFVKSMIHFISQQNGGQLPNELLHELNQFELSSSSNTKQPLTIQQEKPPSIFITSHDPTSTNNHPLLDDIFNVTTRSPLTVQTQNLHCNNNNNNNNRSTLSSLGPYGNQLPPSPSPSMLVSDDELDNTSSLYSPNSPHTPRHSTHSATTHTNTHTNTNNTTTNTSYAYISTLDPLSHHHR